MAESNGMLHSSFTASAQLRGSYHSLKQSLSDLCYLAPLTTGTDIEYTVRISGKKETNPVLRLRRDSISFKFFFQRPNVLIYNRNFAIFASILAYLADFYDVKMSSLYCYIIELATRSGHLENLHGQQKLTLLEKNLSAISAINSSLSHELVRLSKEKLQVTNQLEALTEFCKELMQSAKALGTNESSTPTILSSTFGISEAVLASAIEVINTNK
ncbi:MAG TPA: hypothetical protein VND15_01995 [Candidatus Acidoferrales bacterium]|nr:hypothetical protein [Candidatus Acidoferrales bacterium]